MDLKYIQADGAQTGAYVLGELAIDGVGDGVDELELAEEGAENVAANYEGHRDEEGVAER